MNHVNTDAAVKALKQLADKESIEKLKRTPDLAFRKLTGDKRVGAYTARLIYLAMLAGLIDYVEKDDYYPPVPEDYDDNFREDVLKPFCEKYGLECVSFSGQGEGADSYIRN